MSESSKGEKNPNWGKHMSKESIQKRNSNPNRKSRKGIPMSEEQKKKLKGKRESVARGNHYLAKKVINTETQEIFECALDAAESISMDRRKLNSWLLHPHRNKTTLKYLENA